MVWGHATILRSSSIVFSTARIDASWSDSALSRSLSAECRSASSLCSVCFHSYCGVTLILMWRNKSDVDRDAMQGPRKESGSTVERRKSAQVLCLMGNWYNCNINEL